MSLSIHKSLKPQIPPHSLAPPLHGARNPKRSMLIRNDIILVLRVRRLVLRRHVDFFNWQIRRDRTRRRRAVGYGCCCVCACAAAGLGGGACACVKVVLVCCCGGGDGCSGGVWAGELFEEIG